jgi:hypothetical protein
MRFYPSAQSNLTGIDPNPFHVVLPQSPPEIPFFEETIVSLKNGIRIQRLIVWLLSGGGSPIEVETVTNVRS